LICGATVDRTNPRGPISIQQFSDDVAGFIHELGLAPVSVVGISLGGMVAFQLAADHPELIDRLVVVNALPDNKLLQQARGQIWMRKLIVRFLGLERMGTVLGGRIFPGEDMEEERALMAQRWAENGKRAYQHSFQAAVDWPGVTERLSGFEGPTLMVSSEHDYVGLDQKQPYLDALPGVRHVVVDDARHAVPMERPHRFNQVLSEFLAD
jgi:3-oxoadipate enol-lactonase